MQFVLRFGMHRIALFFFTLTLAATGFSQEKRPNIVFLLADDQALWTLGCYGNEDVVTPNIDQLAAEGVVFENHYDTTAICMASRANIFTGLYEYRHGCNFGLGDLSSDLWNASYPQLLKKAGYTTAFAGKYGVEVEGRGLPAEDFDAWGGGPGQTNYATKKNKSMVDYADEFPHSSVSYGAFGRDFIQKSAEGDAPFCLSISFKAPHMPATPDRQFDDVYAGKTFQKPENYGREFGEHFSEQSRQGRQFERFHSWNYADKYDQVMRLYYQQIHGIDQAVGMIRAELEAQQLLDNTVIIYTSDNGFLCGAHGYGSKVLPYEEATRVPLIIRAPGVKPARSAALTGNIDLGPTMLAVAGVNAPEGLDGVSLLPLLSKPGDQVRDSLALMNFWGPEAVHSFAVVTSDWKYVLWNYAGKDMKPAEELFDKNRDALELQNAALNPEKRPQLTEMQKLYDQEVRAIAEKSVRPAYKGYGEHFKRGATWAP
ncbi:MAG: arylsulfatase A-like enzyme [Verrucomicrobiales bacterium]|jgi:arylsulfatase A-like enzyme